MDQVVEANKRTLGEEHRNTLVSMHNLALRYCETGRRQKALQLIEKVVEANKKTLGEENPDTLHSMRTLLTSNEPSNNIIEIHRRSSNPEIKPQAQNSTHWKRKSRSSLAHLWKKLV